MSKTMTDEKQRWMIDAAEEIAEDCIKPRNYTSEVMEYRKDRAKAIEAIIKQHRPEDKGAGKLVEALEEIRDFPARYGRIFTVEAGKAAVIAIAGKAAAALAEYEEANK